jgi:hypothetical protein
MSCLVYRNQKKVYFEHFESTGLIVVDQFKDLVNNISLQGLHVTTPVNTARLPIDAN